MDNRTNTIIGWALAGCAAALGLSIVSGMVFHTERPETMGFPIEGVVEEGEGGPAEVPIATLLASADVAAGETSFAKCASCHTINQGGPNGIGPNLYGVMGKPHGHLAGFAYSDALTSIPGNWDFESMSAWLASPRRYAPGTKMSFAGLSDPQERANVIAYLNSQGSNLPLPEAPAAAAPESPAEDAAIANATAGQQTGDLENVATVAPGAPSQDPAAAEKGAEAE